jgi:hypothetical protein
MAWPFKPRTTRPCFPVGPYCLNSSITALHGLTELSHTELYVLNSQCPFRGEKILHAPHVEFVGRSWDPILGTVDNRIYKIALQIGELTRGEGRAIHKSVVDFVTKQQESKPKREGPMLVWDTSDGNIVFHESQLGEEIVLKFFLTSSAVRTFQRL